MPTYNFNILYNHDPQNPVSFSTMRLFFGNYGSTTIPAEDHELTSISDSLYHIRYNVSFESDYSNNLATNVDASIFLNIVTLGLVTSVEFNFSANYNCYDYYVTNDTTYNTGNTLDDWCVPWQFMFNFCGARNYILNLPSGQSYNQLFKRQEFDEGNFLSNYGSFAYGYLNGNIIYYDDSERMTKYSDLALFEFVNSSGGGGSGSTQTLQYATVEIINNLGETITVYYYSDYTSNVITSFTSNVAHGSSISLNNGNSVNCSSTNSAGFYIYPTRNLTIEIYSMEKNVETYTTTYQSGIVPVYTLVKRYLDNFGINEDELNHNTIDFQFTLS